MIRFIGKISRKEVNELYGKSRVGIVVYQPAANHMESQPIKMFEFMAAGLPVVASNFPLWVKIIEEAQCGICVNPQNSEEVKNACKKLVSNPKEAECLGRNGRYAVEQVYNWAFEEKKLLALYENLGGQHASL